MCYNDLCPIVYRICSKCGKHRIGTIVGATGSANYSGEYKEKQNAVRYNRRCGLWNTRIVDEIFTDGLNGVSGRSALFNNSIRLMSEKQGKISAQELLDQEINNNCTMHIDSYQVKYNRHHAKLSRDRTTLKQN